MDPTEHFTLSERQSYAIYVFALHKIRSKLAKGRSGSVRVRHGALPRCWLFHQAGISPGLNLKLLLACQAWQLPHGKETTLERAAFQAGRSELYIWTRSACPSLKSWGQQTADKNWKERKL